MKILRKNQLAILVISLMLVTAGYLNYTANNENLLPVSSEVSETNVASIGDATLVNSNDIVDNTSNEQETNDIETNTEVEEDFVSTDEYFVSSRLERDTMYSQMLETYQKIIDSTSVSADQKAISQQEITNINNTKNAIMIAENLIKTKGFEDVIIFVNGDSISVIIKKDKLSQEEIAQIQNIISRELKADIENIHISNKE